ncbi:Aldehyde dehydrogenase 4 family member A1 [Fasciolopsis buskii]|uniref:L-glutamate gamma-semialdehyde dehydrogenase n=1 Tax=Fasciolopsis buskii TaxID=27845 RepID=A0A8E0RXT1_9TREM|nr:Aldehyde dehydrogenase 4 family member A1 [Fasciolopsis buski]
MLCRCSAFRHAVHGTSRIPVVSLSYKATNEPIMQHRRGSQERKRLDGTIQSMLQQSPYEVPICIGSEEFTSSTQKKQVLPFDHRRSLANFYYASEQQLKNAITAALKAREIWSRTEFDTRARIFLKAADMISDQNRFQLLASTMLGQAKTIFQAEIDAAAELVDFIRFNVQFASVCSLCPQSISSSPSLFDRMPFVSNPSTLPMLRIESFIDPLKLGFWAAIPPFNFTAIAGNLASAPALMGNVVLWKPSDSAVIFREAGLPPGVINFVPADGSTFGSVITKHPQLAGVNFTGSTRTFRTILKEMSKNLELYRGYPRTIGECGGKNYHLIHPSADVNEAALATIRSAFEYSGQKCSACSRLYVPASLWPKMKSLLLEHHRQLKIGSPLDHDTFTSAVIDQTAFRKISGYLDYAKSCPDIELIAGGNADDSRGYFIEPTILLTKNPTDKVMKYPSLLHSISLIGICFPTIPHSIVFRSLFRSTFQDDIFGPVVCAYVYNDNQIEQVMDLVDSTTDYALTGAIFAKDQKFIQRATDRLLDTTGNFYVNVQSTGSVVGQQPFGGARLSGTNDKAGGPQYVLRFTSPLSIKTQKTPITSWKQQHME